MLKNKMYQVPDFAVLPHEVYFRFEDFDVHGAFDTHSHAWGMLCYGATGVMSMVVAGKPYLSPPQYAIWIPPDTPHSARFLQNVVCQSAYIDAALCADLPAEPCAVMVGPLIKCILADFAGRGLSTPVTEADRRLALVLVDQLRAAPSARNYLPGSDDALLSPLLAALRDEPGDLRTLDDWAAQLGVTGRTLARRCQSELGISFGELRQRQRYLAALPLLEAGATVQSVALALGYSTASAFIAMFRRQSGDTPAARRPMPAMAPFMPPK